MEEPEEAAAASGEAAEAGTSRAAGAQTAPAVPGRAATSSASEYVEDMDMMMAVRGPWAGRAPPGVGPTSLLLRAARGWRPSCKGTSTGGAAGAERDPHACSLNSAEE